MMCQPASMCFLLLASSLIDDTVFISAFAVIPYCVVIEFL